RQRDAELAVAKHLDAVPDLSDHLALYEQFGGNRLAALKPCQVAYVHDRVLRPKGLVVESALGKAHVNGKLSALESRTLLAPRTRSLPLLASFRSLARAGADAPPDPPPGLPAPRCALQRVQIHAHHDLAKSL